MGIEVDVIGLHDMLENKEATEEQIKALLLSFVTLGNGDIEAANDVQDFLHTKAIMFSKLDLSRTFLVLEKTNYDLLGYFSITSKSWEIGQRNYTLLTANQKKKLGLRKNSDDGKFKIKGHLIGQIGINYAVKDKYSEFTGKDLFKITCDKIKEGFAILGGRVTWLECCDSPKIHAFYSSFGFTKMEDYVSPNGYNVFFKQTRDL